jgi:hypothetical protein
MLHRDPQQRPHTIGEVETALRQFQRYYGMVKAEIPEVISPYEAAIETQPLSIIKAPILRLKKQAEQSNTVALLPPITLQAIHKKPS